MKVTAKKTKQTSMRGWTSINMDTVTGVVVMLPEEEEGKEVVPVLVATVEAGAGHTPMPGAVENTTTGSKTRKAEE